MRLKNQWFKHENCHTGWGGVKKCHVLIEWPLSQIRLPTLKNDCILSGLLSKASKCRMSFNA